MTIIMTIFIMIIINSNKMNDFMINLYNEKIVNLFACLNYLMIFWEIINLNLKSFYDT